MEILIGTIMGIVVVFAFYLGFKLGKGEVIKPIPQLISERKEKIVELNKQKEIEKELDEFNRRLNIEETNLTIYDGTSIGQKKVK